MTQDEMKVIDGGIGWDDLGFCIVTACGAIIGGVVGTCLFPGSGTVGGVKAGSAIGGVIGSAIFGAGYILIG